jgi:hypothetical protein
LRRPLGLDGWPDGWGTTNIESPPCLSRIHGSLVPSAVDEGPEGRVVKIVDVAYTHVRPEIL